MLIEYTAAEVAAVRVALTRYSEELEKLLKKEGELGVVSTEADRCLTAANVALDKVMPQIKLALTPLEQAVVDMRDAVPPDGSVTISAPGSGREPVTLKGRTT